MENICYRCGMRIAERTICPYCGFDLHSPVEIIISRRMFSVSVYRTDTKEMLWNGRKSEEDPVIINAPSPVPITVRWAGITFERMMVNGEAYKFIPAGCTNSFRLIRTRMIPKKHGYRSKEPPRGNEDAFMSNYENQITVDQMEFVKHSDDT